MSDPGSEGTDHANSVGVRPSSLRSVMAPGAQPAILFNQNAKETKLNATMDKKPLKPGTYLMNIVAHNATSRVVFTVEDKTGKLKMPDFKKVFDFLSKKK